MRHRLANLLLAIVVSVAGFGLFWCVLFWADQRRCVADAKLVADRAFDMLQQRIESVDAAAADLSSVPSLDDARVQQGIYPFRSDSMFEGARYIRRLASGGSIAGGGSGGAKSESDSDRGNRPITDSAQGQSGRHFRASEFAIYAREQIRTPESSLMRRMYLQPEEVVVADGVISRAVHFGGQVNGVLAVQFSDFFAAPDSATLDSTIGDLTRGRILKSVSDDRHQQVTLIKDGQALGLRHVNTMVRQVGGGKVSTGQAVEGDTYLFESYEKARIARRRIELSLFGLVLGPLFVVMLNRTRLKQAAQVLESRNVKLADEVLEQQDVQKTLMTMLSMREQERRLLASEIHDGFVQEVMSAQMFLEALAARLPASFDETAKRHLSSALQQLEIAIAESRQLINHLKPQPVDRMGLIPALQALFEGYQERFGMQVSLRYPPELLHAEVLHDKSIYRIVQEALTNIRKHSGVNEAFVSLHSSADWLTVDIVDNGSGFQLDEVGDEGFGLTSIQERASLLGGSVDISTEPGEGTKLKVVVPAVPSSDAGSPASLRE